MTYQPADPHVSRFFLNLQRLGEARLAEIEQVRREYREAGCDGVRGWRRTPSARAPWRGAHSRCASGPGPSAASRGSGERPRGGERVGVGQSTHARDALSPGLCHRRRGRDSPEAGQPLPKAGVFAHGEGEPVAKNIAHASTGAGVAQRFDGQGECFIEIGDGKAGFSGSNFYAEPTPAVKLHPPSWRWI